MTEHRLRRTQWAVRATLALGVAASVTANILHARPHPISQAIAAWPPVALLIAVELVSRVPIHRRWLGALRLAATFAIAGIAAWVSYHHMAAVVARYGETGNVPYLLPLSVDGLIIVASVSLVELAGHRYDTAAPALKPAAAVDSPIWPVTTPPVESTPPESGVSGRVDGRGEDNGVAADTDTDVDPDVDGIDVEHDDTGLVERELDEGSELAADLVPLLPAARAAWGELVDEGRTVSRDALARRLRRNGHSIRNNRVSELLAALRQETPSVNGSRHTASV